MNAHVAAWVTDIPVKHSLSPESNIEYAFDRRLTNCNLDLNLSIAT
jgi:hypothetical protein